MVKLVLLVYDQSQELEPVCVPEDCPPTVIVTLPAVCPVIVQLTWYLYPLVMLALWVSVPVFPVV